MNGTIHLTDEIIDRMRFISLLKRYRGLLLMSHTQAEESAEWYELIGDAYASEVLRQFAQSDLDEIDLVNSALEWVSENLPRDDPDLS